MATLSNHTPELKDNFHLLTAQEAVAAVGGDCTSTAEAVESQRARYGANRLAEASSRSLLAIIIGNFCNSLTAILAAVFVLAVVIEEWIEAVVVVLIILLNGTISIVQEYQSERSMAAIRHLGGATEATVVRGGRTATIPLAEVVVGDVVSLRLGDVVPADIRLVEVRHSRHPHHLLSLTRPTLPRTD